MTEEQIKAEVNSMMKLDDDIVELAKSVNENNVLTKQEN